ncbi:MAG: hypothetical protein RLQ12_06270 [Cyclobacteriaceae bacterium]
MAIAGDPGVSDSINYYVEKAKADLLTHLNLLGDKGWTPEGFDYLRYELCTGVLPFVMAYQGITGVRLAEEAPVVQWFAPFMAMQTVVNDKVLTPDYGVGGIHWNVNRWRSGDLAMSLGVVPDKYKPAVFRLFDQAFGLNGDQTFDIYKPGDAVFALINYPFDQSEYQKGVDLPNFWADEKAGYFILRDKWESGDGFVTTITTNQLARPGSHSHKEAGSFRIIGFGEVCACWGTKTPGVRNENLENTVKMVEATNWRGAEVIEKEHQVGSGMSMLISMDITNYYLGGSKFQDSIYLGVNSAIRSFYVKYPETGGANYVIYDKISGGNEKTWEMFTSVEDVSAYENGFEIRSKSGSVMYGKIFIPAKVKVNYDPEIKKVFFPVDFESLVTLEIFESDSSNLYLFDESKSDEENIMELRRILKLGSVDSSIK